MCTHCGPTLDEGQEQRVRLIHWHAGEAKERIQRLESAGVAVDFRPLDGGAALRELWEAPPSAVVIDLTRLPSHGRDVAVLLRERKRTRRVPLIFVDGDPDKVARVQALLPDAVFTTWSCIESSLRQAMADTPEDPVVPGSSMAGYAGTPLWKKLRIKANSTVGLVGAPPGFEEALGQLPQNVTFRRRLRGLFDLIIWFVGARRDLEGRIERMGQAMSDSGGLWIAWPKKASGVASDVSQASVRQVGLAAGLVDYKVCSIDATWSGLLFSRCKPG